MALASLFADFGGTGGGPLDPRAEKFVRLLFSRKVWVALLALLSALGVVDLSDVEQAGLIKAILIIGSAVGVVLGIALEDSGHAIAKAIKERQ